MSEKKKISQQTLRQPEASPSMGTTSVAGKSNDADGAEQARNNWVETHKPEAVREVDPEANAGACIAAGLKQRVGADGVEDGNPKHRTTNAFGIEKNPKL